MDPKRKILYVDDEEINLLLFELTFKKNYTIITASSAIEGLEILNNHPGIELIISDLKMPVMNGLDFITRIKERKRHIVCMLLSGYVESEVIMEGFNRDYLFRYLVKPWNKEMLIATIEEAFAKVVG